MVKHHAPIGTISHGTLRNEDLLESFSDMLENLIERYQWQGMTDQETAFAEFRTLIGEARATDPDSEIASEIVAELMDALDSFSPPYVIFGSHVGDGSDFGFWPDVESAIEDAAESGYRLEISDHGNVSLYDSDGVEIWGVV